MPRYFKSSRCLVPIRPHLLTGPGSPVSLLYTVRLPTPPQHLPRTHERPVQVLLSDIHVRLPSCIALAWVTVLLSSSQQSPPPYHIQPLTRVLCPPLLFTHASCPSLAQRGHIPVHLSKLHTLHVNGYPLLAYVVDVLVCLALEALCIEVMNAPINSGMGVGMGGMPGWEGTQWEETIISLVRCSGHLDITSLYIAYTTYSASLSGVGLGGGIFGFGGTGRVGGGPYPDRYHYIHPGSVIS